MKKKTQQTQMKILSIDPASTLGWAVSNSEYGEWDLRTRKDESMGMKLIRLRSKLDEMHSLLKIDLVVYERPAGQHKNPIIHQSKLIGLIEEWCESNDIEYRGYSSTEIKKYATGKGNAGKPLMIKTAEEKYNLSNLTDNEADALHMLNLTMRDYETTTKSF